MDTLLLLYRGQFILLCRGHFILLYRGHFNFTLPWTLQFFCTLDTLILLYRGLITSQFIVLWALNLCNFTDSHKRPSGICCATFSVHITLRPAATLLQLYNSQYQTPCATWRTSHITHRTSAFCHKTTVVTVKVHPCSSHETARGNVAYLYSFLTTALVAG